MQTKLWLRYGLPSALVTVILTLIVANLGHQKKIMVLEIPPISAITSNAFRLSMENMLGPPLTHGNRVTAYQNGEEIFPAMLAGIRAAKKTINFESYIYLSGKVGNEFVEALAVRARAGVQVHLLIDWVGSGKISPEMLDQLRAAGAQVEFYHPVAWYSITRLNNRTHRKILVIDGKLGFTGGVGISDAWAGRGDTPDVWRDSQYRLEGPAVGQLQSAFTANWMSTRPEVFHGNDYFPPIEENGPSLAQVFESFPGEASESAELMYLLSIAAAKESIYISSAYFIPGENERLQLAAAAKRGVKIQVLAPGLHNDSEVARLASRALWEPLLEAGVEIYEFEPAMLHRKVMIVDRAWVSVGSTNFDARSLTLNSESNLNVLDAAFANAELRVFEKDLEHSHRVTLAEWRARGWPEKMKGWAALTLRSQL
jgi:cardiolipin synthase